MRRSSWVSYNLYWTCKHRSFAITGTRRMECCGSVAIRRIAAFAKARMDTHRLLGLCLAILARPQSSAETPSYYLRLSKVSDIGINSVSPVPMHQGSHSKLYWPSTSLPKLSNCCIRCGVQWQMRVIQTTRVHTGRLWTGKGSLSITTFLWYTAGQRGQCSYFRGIWQDFARLNLAGK